MSDKKYWTSFAALKNKEEIEKMVELQTAGYDAQKHIL